MTNCGHWNRRLFLLGGAGAALGLPAAGAQPRYLQPGVYVEEIPTAASTIRPAPTDITLFIGRFSATSPEGVATECVSYSQFVTAVGNTAIADYPPSALAIELFFANGGQTAIFINTPPGPDYLAGLTAAKEDASLRYNLMYLPGAASEVATPSELAQIYTVANDLCTAQRAMLLVDAPTAIAEAADWQANIIPSSANIAAYAPAIAPTAPSSSVVGAGGAIAGIIARTDRETGVWQAPAGLSADLRQARAVTALDASAIDSLQLYGINALMDTLSGTLVWGARTQAQMTDLDQRYVSARRTLMFIEDSLDQSLKWTAFEANDGALWTRLRAVTEHFLLGLWKKGALLGASPAQAFFARCGLGSTMTQIDVQNGRATLTAGVALLRPSEFSVVQLDLETLA